LAKLPTGLEILSRLAAAKQPYRAALKLPRHPNEKTCVPKVRTYGVLFFKI
jgi:hypothetical protein